MNSNNKSLSTALFVFIGILLAGLPQSVMAAPILNRGAPAGPGIIVYPDHLDKNLYYLNPTSIRMAKDEKGTPLFSYTEYYAKTSWGSPYFALIQAMLIPATEEGQITAAQETLKKQNPNAVFSALPFYESRLKITPNLEKLIAPASCSHRAGVVGQLQDCSISLTPMGKRVLLPSLRQGIALSLEFEYTISGMLEKADGTLEETLLPMGVGGYIGGSELMSHPELFRFLR